MQIDFYIFSLIFTFPLFGNVGWRNNGRDKGLQTFNDLFDEYFLSNVLHLFLLEVQLLLLLDMLTHVSDGTAATTAGLRGDFVDAIKRNDQFR